VRRPRFAPSDGIAAAALAQVALERGAWIAAANRPLAGILSLEPRIADADVDLLHDRQVNVLIRGATGFLFIDAQTLSRDTDTRSLSVRRL
jgi:phage tail sheath protein FI